jgi:hypothetical protein
MTSADNAEPAEQTETTEPSPAPLSQQNNEPPTTSSKWSKFVDAHGRNILSAATELAGIAALSAGFWLIHPWCGLIALGVGLILLGMASSPRFDRKKESR